MVQRPTIAVLPVLAINATKRAITVQVGEPTSADVNTEKAGQNVPPLAEARKPKRLLVVPVLGPVLNVTKRVTTVQVSAPISYPAYQY